MAVRPRRAADAAQSGRPRSHGAVTGHNRPSGGAPPLRLPAWRGIRRTGQAAAKSYERPGMPAASPGAGLTACSFRGGRHRPPADAAGIDPASARQANHPAPVRTVMTQAIRQHHPRQHRRASVACCRSACAGHRAQLSRQGPHARAAARWAHRAGGRAMPAPILPARHPGKAMRPHRATTMHPSFPAGTPRRPQAC